MPRYCLTSLLSPVGDYCYAAPIMTVSAIPPKYQRGIGIMWIVMVVLGLIVAIGRNFMK